MSDLPIIFSAPMVRAFLEGRKTQTRRIIKPQPSKPWGSAALDGSRFWTYESLTGEVIEEWRLPYAPGDRLYVRESHSLHRAHGQDFKRPADDHGVRWGPWSGLPIAVSPDKTQVAYYRQGFDRSGPPKWRPSIHMPRWASRLTLTVTDVRVQRLQDCSAADARAEGVVHNNAVDPKAPLPLWSVPGTDAGGKHPQDAYAALWNSLHGPEAWDANPWVAAYSFTVQQGNIDRIRGAA